MDIQEPLVIVMPEERPNAQTPSSKNKVHRREFPMDFFFGAAGSAYQYEGAYNQGNRGPSIWDTFTQRTPEKISDGSNGNMAVNSYHLYKEDVQLCKKTGLNAYRISLSWPRIFPGGRLSAGINREGVKYYNDLINELLANGIEPFVTLFHWDLPQALEDEYGGFLNDKIVGDFLEYAEFCFWEFGDRVKHWVTFNEPYSYSVYGYCTGTFAPGRGGGGAAKEHVGGVVKELHVNTVVPTKFSSVLLKRAAELGSNTIPASRLFPGTPIDQEKGDPATEPYTVTRLILLAHKAAVMSYRNNFQKRPEDEIGIVLNCTWMVPLTSSKEDIEAKQRALDFMLGWFMEPLTTGQYPESMIKLVKDRLQPFCEKDSNQLKGCYDFIGINYYTATYVENGPKPKPGHLSYLTDAHVTYTFDRDGKPIGPVAYGGWQHIVPWGLFALLVYMVDKYNVPLLYVTENGLVGQNNPKILLKTSRDDKDRKEFLQAHLLSLREAIDYGANVKGYFVWSLLDNFEWNLGYIARYGLFYVDYNNYFARYPKESAIWYKNFIQGKLTVLQTKRRLEDDEEFNSVKKIKG